MLPPHYSVELQLPAVEFLNGCDEAELRRLRRLIEEIRQDPEIDESRKIAVASAPVVFRVMVAEGYWIAYHVRIFNSSRPDGGDAKIWILGIKRSPSPPTATELISLSSR